MVVPIAMSLRDIIGNIQDVFVVGTTTIPRPNGLTVVTGGRMMAHEAISEGRVVEETIDIGEGAGKRDSLFIGLRNCSTRNFEAVNPWGLSLTGFVISSTSVRIWE